LRGFPHLARALLNWKHHADGRRDESNDLVSGRPQMFSFDRFARVATAAIGALVLSTLSITAAVGPIRAAGIQNAEVASAHQVGAHV
jgi:hypothetical protein